MHHILQDANEKYAYRMTCPMNEYFLNENKLLYNTKH